MHGIREKNGKGIENQARQGLYRTVGRKGRKDG